MLTHTTILQAPAEAIQTTTILPSPLFDDQEGDLAVVMHKRSMNNTLYSYVKDYGRQRLVYKYRLFRPKAFELQAFIETYLNAKWRMTDYKGNQWLVNLINNPEFDFSQVARDEITEITLEFEGVQVPIGPDPIPPVIPADHYVITGPAVAIVNTLYVYTVTAENSSNFVDLVYNGTVTFTSSDPLSSLPIPRKLISGVGVFSATLRTLGSQEIVATDHINYEITGVIDILVETSGMSFSPQQNQYIGLIPNVNSGNDIF